MKRLIALLLCIVLVLSLCACKGKDKSGANGGNEEGKSQEGGAAAEDSTEPFDITTLENYYQDLSEPQVEADKMTYKIFQAWYTEESLVLDIYFINGHTEPVTEVWFDDLSIYNGDYETDGEVTQGGLISYAMVGPVEMEEAVPAGSYSVVRLYMPKDLEGPLVDLSMEVADSYEW